MGDHYQLQWERLGVQELVPEQAKLRSLWRPSVLAERSRVKFQPVNGSTFTGASSKISFQISDAGSHLDLRSMALALNLVVGGTAGSARLSSNALNLFSRITIAVAGEQVYDSAAGYLGISAIAELYASAPASALNGYLGAAIGESKFNEAQYATYTASTVGNSSFMRNAPNLRVGNVSGVQMATAGIPLNIPLSLLCAMCRSPQLFPLRNFSPIAIELWLNPVSVALVDSGSIGTYTLTNVVMACDLCRLDSSYTSIYDSIVQDPESSGVMFPYEQNVVYNNVYSPGTGSSAKNVLISAQRSNLKRLYWTAQTTTKLTDATAEKTSWNDAYATAGPAAMTSLVYQIGGKRYPAQPIQDLGEALYHTMRCFHGTPVPAVAPVLDCCNFMDLSGSGAQVQASARSQIFGYSFERVQGEGSDDSRLDGISTTGGGSIVVIQVTDNNSAAATMITTVVSQDVLELKGSRVRHHM